MFIVGINNTIFHLPSNWNELTKNQLIRLAQLSFEQLSPSDFKTKLVIYILDFEIVKFREQVVDGETCFYFRDKKHKAIYLFSATDIAFIANKLDFLFKVKTEKTPTGEKELWLLDTKLTKNIISNIRVKLNTLYGPADGLSNILFQEWIHTETYYIDFCKTNDFTLLDKLIAVLYRPEVGNFDNDDVQYTGDRRDSFNDFLIDKRAAIISQLPQSIKYSLFLFYTGCRNHIHQMFKEVFSGSVSGEEQNTFKNMMIIVNSLANNDVTKNEKIRKTYLYEVMFALQQICINNKKLEELYKK